MATSNKIREVLQRKEILDRISSGTRDRTVLVHEVDVSRSTVYRALDTLERHGLVAEHQRAYEVTPVGKILHRELSRVCCIANNLEELGPVVTDGTLESLSVEVLTNATVRTPSRYAPKGHLEQVSDLIDRSTSVDVLLPAPTPKITESIAASSSETRIRVVLEREMVAYLKSETSGDPSTAILDQVEDLFVVDGTLPYAVVSFERPESGVCVVFYDDGQANASIVDTSVEGYSWGRDVYETFSERATPMDDVSDDIP